MWQSWTKRRCCKKFAVVELCILNFLSTERHERLLYCHNLILLPGVMSSLKHILNSVLAHQQKATQISVPSRWPRCTHGHSVVWDYWLAGPLWWLWQLITTWLGSSASPILPQAAGGSSCVMGNRKNMALVRSRGKKISNPTFAVENSLWFVCHCTTLGREKKKHVVWRRVWLKCCSRWRGISGYFAMTVIGLSFR